MQKCQGSIKLKILKEDFSHEISCELINPSKSDTDKIGKIIIDKINKTLVTSTLVNQWKNTQSVIN